MIQRERIADNVYAFQSEVYAQVTAGAVIGPNWAVVIDTLALPEETLAVRDFIEQELSVPVRYLVNTHSHADHAWGNCFFPGATILAHELCRQYLDTAGRSALEDARENNLAFRNMKIVLPQMTFGEGQVNLRVGKKTLTSSISQAIPSTMWPYWLRKIAFFSLVMLQCLCRILSMAISMT